MSRPPAWLGRVAGWAPALTAAACGGLWLMAAWTLREHHPPVWPDEALFAEPALRLLQRGELATDQLAGLIPGIEHHTFWVPPLYLLLLAAVFFVTGPGLLPVRVTSMALGLVVLLLLWAVGRRAGLCRRLSLLAPAVVALDVLFLRASVVGRMDGLCVALALAAAWVHLRSDASPRTDPKAALRWPLAAGVVAGLAALAHPMGLAAVGAVLGATLLSPRGRGRPVLVVAGLALALLPWLLWGAAHAGDFAAQLGAQLSRKADKGGLTAPWESLRMALRQSGTGEGWAALYQVAGLVGLLAAAWRRPALSFLAILQGLWILLVIGGREMWYPVYPVPLAALGLALLVPRIADAPAVGPGDRRPGRTLGVLVACLFLSIAVALSWRNARRTRALVAQARVVSADGMPYEAYCRRIRDALPVGSSVLLAVIPDPWLGLQGARPDLRLRQFAPTGLGVPAAAWRRALRASDRIVVGRDTISPEVAAFVRAHGVLEAEVGRRAGQGAYARIFRLDHASGGGGRDSTP